ncbi:hypothetical protein ABW20_dc0100033 [Dactylellina cionopaga]|nr:hypothetical protein ABW20_dc0100033 [Dactylellina cionopaga]
MSKNVNKVYLQKDGEDFIVLVEDKDIFEKWKKDSSVPLAHVMDIFKVYTTHGQGPQGILDSASNAMLKNAFNTKNEDDIIKTILTEGTLQSSSVSTLH